MKSPESLNQESFIEITALAIANVRRARHGLDPITLKALKRDKATWEYFRVEQRSAWQALKESGYLIFQGEK